MLTKKSAAQDQTDSVPYPELAFLINQYFLQKDKSQLSSPQKMNNDEVKKLVQWLQTQPQITSLGLYLNNINALGVMNLVTCTSLTILNLGINPLGDEGAKIIADSASLTDVDLRSAGIGPKGAGYLALNTVLKILNLHNNNLGDEGARQLGTLNTTLSTLRLQNNKIGAGARHLVAHPTITLLCLAENPISKEDFIDLTNNKTLTSFDVSGVVAEQCQLNIAKQKMGRDKIVKFLILIAIEKNNTKSTSRLATTLLDLIKAIFSCMQIADVGLNSSQLSTLFDLIMNRRTTIRADLKNNTLTFFKTRKFPGADEYKVEATPPAIVPHGAGCSVS